MSQRYAGPFRVTERTGTLAYRLDMSNYNARVNDVVSVDHLEPAPFDPHGRALPPVGDIRAADHPRERIIAKRMVRGKPQYLTKYDGPGHEFDEWLTPAQLGADVDLIQQFQSTETK